MKRMSAIMAGLAATSAILTAAPAQAFTARADGYDRCPDNHFCIFEHSDGTGMYAAFTDGTDNLGDPKVFGGRMNDKTSAVWNRTTTPWCICEHANRGGRRAMIPKKPHVKSKGALVADWQDITSTVRPAKWVKPPRFPYGWWEC